MTGLHGLLALSLAACKRIGAREAAPGPGPKPRLDALLEGLLRTLGYRE